MKQVSFFEELSLHCVLHYITTTTTTTTDRMPTQTTMHNAVEKIFFYICFQGKFPTEFEEQIGLFQNRSPRGFIVQWNRPMRSNVVLIVCRFANGTFYSLGISMAMRAVGQAITHVLRACRLRLALVIFAELLLCQ
ncbi:Ubiquitin carboxyl-terminal hydrolase [Trichinella spiralis]|uniref:Ubiquitin carboxyl-terminal hydrolase n=1 Tax=Trichinella spiralis TaxID=6334 RepID=A0ABR3KSR7_TRISP